MMGERELALGMAHFALTSLGLHDDAADVTIGELRRHPPRTRTDDPTVHAPGDADVPVGP
jgi:hypothetical protein